MENENRLIPTSIKKAAQILDNKNILLPTAIKITAQTLGSHLVSVSPMIGYDTEKINKMEQEIKQENRENKIDSALENVPYVEKTIKDHPDYGQLGLPSLSYFDFIYVPDSDDENENI